MKRTFSVILFLGLISLSGFVKESANYEQITFDYFVSDILGSDFKDIKSFEFKGRTEESYSTLGKYRFCLKPEEKLASMIDEITKGAGRKVKEIKYENIKGLTILDFQSKAGGSQLLIYPSVHVADNYYVFLSFQRTKEQPVKYVFELTPEGNISRSCKMD
jgi:hypothetical protein